MRATANNLSYPERARVPLQQADDSVCRQQRAGVNVYHLVAEANQGFLAVL